MSLDIWIILAWVNAYIFIPAWTWANFDLMGLPLYDYLIAIALSGYVSLWAVRRFKHVTQTRYFDPLNSATENELNEQLRRSEVATGFREASTPTVDFREVALKEPRFQDSNKNDVLEEQSRINESVKQAGRDVEDRWDKFFDEKMKSGDPFSDEDSERWSDW
ncbi:hypothetical protein [Methanosarcina siciliae]|uniref:hypothetical protein n=1 Tax=Methanosarcina siciliae TaxID=38027 RepID=UPI00064E65EE|nr:hypothetical protein [Methanosarcina siciliae]